MQVEADSKDCIKRSQVPCRGGQGREKSAFEFATFATLATGAQTDEVRATGQLFTCQPARLLPMAQRYLLFCPPHSKGPPQW